MTKTTILQALRAFVNQRPGLEFGNYGERTSYFSEMRSITKDRTHALLLLRAVEWRDSITAEDLQNACQHAYSGRLSLVERDDGRVAVDYCTGQYFPTEYRRAVCAVLSQALWNNSRDDYPDGNALRKYFKGEFGRSIAARWFN